MNITRCSSARWIGFFCVQSSQYFQTAFFFKCIYAFCYVFVHGPRFTSVYVAVFDVIYYSKFHFAICHLP